MKLLLVSDTYLTLSFDYIYIMLELTLQEITDKKRNIANEYQTVNENENDSVENENSDDFQEKVIIIGQIVTCALENLELSPS